MLEKKLHKYNDVNILSGVNCFSITNTLGQFGIKRNYCFKDSPFSFQISWCYGTVVIVRTFSLS